jgi:hypothetical protein
MKLSLGTRLVRERMLARLALFLGVVALLLAGVGLYGVLDYSVLQRRNRRCPGERMAEERVTDQLRHRRGRIERVCDSQPAVANC